MRIRNVKELPKHYELSCIFCRYKVGDKGVQQAEPRLEPKKHRRQSRKRLNQSILDEFDELDDDDYLVDEENDSMKRAVGSEDK